MGVRDGHWDHMVALRNSRIVSVPLSFFIIKGIGKRSKARFIAQWTHTGVLNAQVEEAFTRPLRDSAHVL